MQTDVDANEAIRAPRHRKMDANLQQRCFDSNLGGNHHHRHLPLLLGTFFRFKFGSDVAGSHRAQGESEDQQTINFALNLTRILFTDSSQYWQRKRARIREENSTSSWPWKLSVVQHFARQRSRQFHIYNSFGWFDVWFDRHHMLNCFDCYFRWNYTTGTFDRCAITQKRNKFSFLFCFFRFFRLFRLFPHRRLCARDMGLPSERELFSSRKQLWSLHFL